MSQELVRPNCLCRQCMKWKGTPYSIVDMHPITGESQTAKQNEGVGIILDPQMTTAWKEAGKIWKAVSSWIVTARIKIARQDGAMPDRWSSRGALFINVISVYVPINPPSCPREGVLRSWEIIDRVCMDDLLLVGDFNVRGGSSGRQNLSIREGVRGYPGVGKMKESGEAHSVHWMNLPSWNMVGEDL